MIISLENPKESSNKLLEAELLELSKFAWHKNQQYSNVDSARKYKEKKRVYLQKQKDY